MRQRPYGHPQRSLCGVVLLLLGLAGCAVHAPPPAPSSDMGYLYVVRTVMDGLGEFIPIEIDRRVRVTLTPQTYIEVALAPGRHTVTSFLGDYTVLMSLDVSRGQPAFVHLIPLSRESTGRVGFEQLDNALGRAAVEQASRVEGSLTRQSFAGEHL